MKIAIVLLTAAWLLFVVYKLARIYRNDFASNVPWLLWIFSAVAVLIAAVAFLFAL